MISESKRVELRNNYTEFKKALPTLIHDHENKFALMRHGEIIAYFETAPQALKAGRRKFDDDLFSVQEVTDVAADLGGHSRAPTDDRL